jgi:CheY-like chemotaxis protein
MDRSQGGLGIGLTLVRSLVELQGGTVEAFSAGEGKGSEFRVQWPAARKPRAQKRVSEEPASLPFSSCRVLIIEDNPDNRDMLRKLIQFWGHQVEVAATGPDGVEKGLSWLPDVVLIDIGLPGMNGFEVARRLRTLPDGRQPLLVAMTGYGQLAERRRSRKAGFQVHLVKPIPLDRLEKMLATRLPAARVAH